MHAMPVARKRPAPRRQSLPNTPPLASDLAAVAREPDRLHFVSPTSPSSHATDTVFSDAKSPWLIPFHSAELQVAMSLSLNSALP